MLLQDYIAEHYDAARRAAQYALGGRLVFVDADDIVQDAVVRFGRRLATHGGSMYWAVRCCVADALRKEYGDTRRVEARNTQSVLDPKHVVVESSPEIDADEVRRVGLQMCGPRARALGALVFGGDMSTAQAGHLLGMHYDLAYTTRGKAVQSIKQQIRRAIA